MSALPDTEQIRDALRKVADPEVGANIVDLGPVLSHRGQRPGRADRNDHDLAGLPDGRPDHRRCLAPNWNASCPSIASRKSGWVGAALAPVDDERKCRLRLGWQEDGAA